VTTTCAGQVKTVFSPFTFFVRGFFLTVIAWWQPVGVNIPTSDPLMP
jgi:hypothetical protein